MRKSYPLVENNPGNEIAPILYSFRRCPYAMRARLAIAVSGYRCTLREVKLSAKPEAMLTASSKGTVPVLVLPDDKVIDESIDIMRWALAKRDPEGWLEGDDLPLIARNDGPFKHDLDRYKYPERHQANPMEHRMSGMEFLTELEVRLNLTCHLCGHVRTMSDAAVAPFVRQFAAVDRRWFDDQPLPRLKAWLTKYTSSELFSLIMLRTEPWSPGDPPVMLTGTPDF